MLYAKVISARLAAPLRSACSRVFESRACPTPFACVSGLTKSCDKHQNFSAIQLKPKPMMVSPSCATQSPEGSCARQNFGKAVEGGAGRGIEKEHAPGFGTGALPGMRHAARHEGAGSGAADRDLIADQEGDLTAQDIGHLVAVVMQVEGALGPGGDGLLEQHDAVAGLSASQFER